MSDVTRGNCSAESIADAKARVEIYRNLEKWFSRLTTMQCPAKWEERMRARAEEWERLLRDQGISP